MARLITVGHGTLAEAELVALFRDAGIERLVDVRSAPGSRRLPHVARAHLARVLPESGVAYRWDRDLGGFRRPRPDSPHVALRHPSFRGYADHMESAPFREALDRLLEEVREAVVAVMCAESLWWRCHRRMIADAVTLLGGCQVVHLRHDGGIEPHRLTPGVRRVGESLCYDAEGSAAAPEEEFVRRPG